MILIDALYISNGGGGKILLDYLMSETEKLNKEVYYLLDKRIEGTIVSTKSQNTVTFMTASLRNRKLFYRKFKSDFTSVLCFGNLPPNIQINAKVYTYFHQLIFLEIPTTFSIRQKVLYTLKTNILRNFRKNTDYWLVQTDYIKRSFQKKFNIKEDKVLLLPFYPPLENIDNIPTRSKGQFIFVSSGTSHKNHGKLINAFCQFYDQHHFGKLTLTVSEEYPEVIKQINDKIQYGYPIKNIGFIPRQELKKHYLQSEYHIFPSLAESFGLGLVEAMENGCKIIGSDLPYTHAVCEPSILFDPEDQLDITRAFERSMQNNVDIGKLKVNNMMHELLLLLK